MIRALRCLFDYWSTIQRNNIRAVNLITALTGLALFIIGLKMDNIEALRIGIPCMITACILARALDRDAWPED